MEVGEKSDREQTYLKARERFAVVFVGLPWLRFQVGQSKDRVRTQSLGVKGTSGWSPSRSKGRPAMTGRNALAAVG